MNKFNLTIITVVKNDEKNIKQFSQLSVKNINLSILLLMVDQLIKQLK